MLKKLLFALGFIALMFPPSVMASTSNTVCTWNSILNRTECTTTTTPDIRDKLDALKAQYGSTNYNSCYAKSGLGGSLGSDPYTQQSGYNYMKYCLETMAIQDKAGNDFYNRIQCSNPAKYPNGAVWFNGRCVGYDEGCRENFGPNSYYKGTDANGKLLCADKTTSVPNALPSQVSNPPVSQPAPAAYDRDAICRQQQGQNSFAINQSDGTFVCDCKPGFMYNANSTCVAIQKQQVQQKNTIKKAPNSEPEIKGQAVAQEQAPAQEVKKPGFFKKIINWFKNLFK